jgi:cysteine desulfurase
MLTNKYRKNLKISKKLIIKLFSNITNINLASKLNVTLDKSEVGKKTVFFDFQSTTPLDPRVLDEMLPYMTVRFGNPHSNSHEFGWEADKAVENAREVIIDLN